MKEVRLEDVFDEYFETHDTCTMQELYHFVHDYREKNNCYVPYHRDEIDYILHTLKTYFFDDKAQVLRKQETMSCPCCGTKFRKYPDTAFFKKLINWTKKK